ncbi:hypothetical protein [Halotalea alkalilenta]|uniref:hypothetical protein n=1 Tax=Halotalea alkalilenta TaxID=376489 RepID=UPI0012DC49ED|nr:hypothetical protein [Halotalea alkalilenta]
MNNALMNSNKPMRLCAMVFGILFLSSLSFLIYSLLTDTISMVLATSRGVVVFFVLLFVSLNIRKITQFLERERNDGDSQR